MTVVALVVVVVALNNTQRASLVLSHQGLTEWNHLSINCKINTHTNILHNNSCNLLTTSYFSVSVACCRHHIFVRSKVKNVDQT